LWRQRAFGNRMEKYQVVLGILTGTATMIGI